MENSIPFPLIPFNGLINLARSWSFLSILGIPASSTLKPFFESPGDIGRVDGPRKRIVLYRSTVVAKWTRSAKGATNGD